ncbi:MAG: EF-hand domain-containing protein [Verrucomicrobiota bacterium]|nr:EF-hand domain-containing protein [Verrucomicrobiota bacterium]
MMKTLPSILIALALGTSFSLAADEKPAGEKKPAAGQKPAGEKAQQDPQAMFKKLDGNGDNFVSLEEFKAGPMGKKDPAKAEETFKKKDKDSDGKLTIDEYKGAGAKKES